MLLGERAHSDNLMNPTDSELSAGSLVPGGGELRTSKVAKSNGSALKNGMSAEKVGGKSPSKNGDNTSHQQARQRDKLLINNGGTVMGGSIPMGVGGPGGP